ncbi:hypothetical protein [Dyadobacter sp. Leaf189]|uniref:hypothetical protein n=1 Tax=Dyadobacter sp. Leaf189 TaxID=1736295 RepID=UPI0006F732A0|nr:hypothetical protein [Dyadobacter sp. Leaf189]KQS31035.1 hypothetical protein ASG33_11790 [Dyadobacter sp. Leaf189]
MKVQQINAIYITMQRLRILYWVLLTVLIGCKEEDIRPEILEQNGIYDFRLEGVPNENIRPWPGFGVSVYLPADYKGGNKIKVSFKRSKKGQVEHLTNEEGWVNGSVTYEGNLIRIKPVFITVVPYKPAEIIAKGAPYRFKLTGRSQQLNFLTRHWGSDFESFDSSGQVRLIHKISGTVEHTTMKATPPASEGDLTPVSIDIPAELAAGEYKVVVYRRGKEKVLPDPLILEIGDIVISDGNHWPHFVTDTNRVLTISGYNFVKEHKYELELNNDFRTAQILKLKVVSPWKLQTTIPDEVAKDNYSAKINIDGKNKPFSNMFKSDNIVVVESDYNQPQLMSLTDLSQRDSTEFGLNVFKPKTTFKKGQNLLAIIFSPNGIFHQGKKLILKDVTTGKVHELYHDHLTGVFSGYLLSHIYFPIPSDFPIGRYEVVHSSVPDGITRRYSERYHRIITIE